MRIEPEREEIAFATWERRMVEDAGNLPPLPETLPLVDSYRLGDGIWSRGHVQRHQYALEQAQDALARERYGGIAGAYDRYYKNAPINHGKELMYLGECMMLAAIGDAVESDLRTMTEQRNS